MICIVKYEIEANSVDEAIAMLNEEIVGKGKLPALTKSDYKYSLEKYNTHYFETVYTPSKKVSKELIDKRLWRLSYKIKKSYEWFKIVPTGLTNQTDYDIIFSVLAQLGDGIWENSLSMRKYVLSSKPRFYNDEVVILVKDSADVYCCGKRYINPFYEKEDREVKSFFATKAKEILKIELEDNEITPSKTFLKDYSNLVSTYIAQNLPITFGMVDNFITSMKS